ncbi:hypothetical protein KVG29_07125 [Caldicoprobacter algeriensis]|uniref:hypothetical protein n=1 Tax=Caldicoprobacter algeriensis TaxID=699281 RepID=UPI00207A70E9|nr:hypothetical protein [Caldicoprobacter algeriensis]MCM8901001.1 hypothetical protein [Caldicoprobacter algeriensis]
MVKPTSIRRWSDERMIAFLSGERQEGFYICHAVYCRTTTSVHYNFISMHACAF